MTTAPVSNRFVRLYQSSIGKKLITGISGLVLVVFITVHMVGNLVLLGSAEHYNQFGHFIERLGPLLWLFELILLGFIGFHILMGVQIFLGRLRARPQAYKTYASVGTPSYQTLSSRTMIVTGLVLGSFLVWHLLTFKFGIRYTVPGSEMRDLARLVIEIFQRPVYTFGYVGVMVLLASHLRHGIWSALQSLGALNTAVRPLVYGVSLMMAIGIALGFVVLPLGIYVGIVR